MPAAQWAGEVEEICDKHANEAEAEGARIVQEAQEEGGSEEEAVARVLERGVERTGPLLDQVAEMPLPQGKEQQAKEFDQRMRDLLPVMTDMADNLRDGGSQADFQQTTKKLMKEVLPVRALARDLNIHACIPNNASP